MHTICCKFSDYNKKDCLKVRSQRPAMSGGAREKALQFLRELPRLSQYNVQGLPGLRKAQPRGYGQNGKERGWGASARQKMYFGPLGYEAGATPIQRCDRPTIPVFLINVVDPNKVNFHQDPEFWPNLDPDPGLCSGT